MHGKFQTFNPVTIHLMTDCHDFDYYYDKTNYHDVHCEVFKHDLRFPYAKNPGETCNNAMFCISQNFKSHGLNTGILITSIYHESANIRKN